MKTRREIELRRVFRIGTRPSPLALRQVEEVLACLKQFYPHIKADIIRIETSGDKDRFTPISDIEGTDFFTRQIDEALLRGEIDFAVHSAKDLADTTPKGISIAAITKSIDPFDALVSKNNLGLKLLPFGAKIAASSQRRKEQLKVCRQDFKIINIRGNIEERLKKFDEDNLEAIIVAACALMRLGLEYRITERVPFEILKPHPLQGSLAVAVRKDSVDLINFLSKIDKRETVLR